MKQLHVLSALFFFLIGKFLHKFGNTALQSYFKEAICSLLAYSLSFLGNLRSHPSGSILANIHVLSYILQHF